jgi:hypothetical protein
MAPDEQGAQMPSAILGVRHARVEPIDIEDTRRGEPRQGQKGKVAKGEVERIPIDRKEPVGQGEEADRPGEPEQLDEQTPQVACRSRLTSQAGRGAVGHALYEDRPEQHRHAREDDQDQHTYGGRHLMARRSP